MARKGRRSGDVAATGFGSPNEAKLVNALDELAEFREFKRELAKPLREALLKGKSGEAILKKFEPWVKARLTNIALTSPNLNAALQAAREILDRVEGKAAQKVDVKHKFSNMKDDELDALLASEARSLEAMQVGTEDYKVTNDDGKAKP